MRACAVIAIIGLSAMTLMANDEEAASILLHVATFGGAGAVDAPDIPTTGLASWWRPGTYLDGTDVIGGHTLTMTGAVTVGSSGYRFSGVYSGDDADEAVYAAYTDDHYGTNFSIGFLLYRHANLTLGAGTSRTTICWADRATNSVADGWIIETVTNTNNYRSLVRGNATYVLANYAGSAVVATGVWQHLCITYDGRTNRIYIDGVRYAQTAGAVTVSNAPQGVTFGARHPQLENTENNQVGSPHADMDEMTLYTVSLESNEVYDLATTLLGTK